MNAISPALSAASLYASKATGGGDATIMSLSVALDLFIARETAAWDALPENFSDDDPAKAEADARGDDTKAVVLEIMRHRASNLDGLLVKVRALQGAISDFEPCGPDSFIYTSKPTTADIVIASIVSDLTHILAASRSASA